MTHKEPVVYHKQLAAAARELVGMRQLIVKALEKNCGFDPTSEKRLAVIMDALGMIRSAADNVLLKLWREDTSKARDKIKDSAPTSTPDTSKGRIVSWPPDARWVGSFVHTGGYDLYDADGFVVAEVRECQREPGVTSWSACTLGTMHTDLYSCEEAKADCEFMLARENQCGFSLSSDSDWAYVSYVVGISNKRNNYNFSCSWHVKLSEAVELYDELAAKDTVPVVLLGIRGNALVDVLRHSRFADKEGANAAAN